MKPHTSHENAPAGQPRQGETTPVMSDGRAPRLPHERDESSSSQASPPRKVMQQAAKDLEAGMQDSSMGPPMDSTYHRQFHKHGAGGKASTVAENKPAKPPR